MRNISIPNTPVNNIWKNLPENLKRRIIQDNVPKARRLPGNLKQLIENPYHRYFNKIKVGANKKLLRLAPQANRNNVRNLIYVNIAGQGTKFPLPKDIRKWSKLQDPKYRKKVLSHHIKQRLNRFTRGQVTPEILKEIVNENIFQNLRGVSNYNSFTIPRGTRKNYL
jgi:hypothetical protein